MSVPACAICRRPMQLNSAVSTEVMAQYMCGCNGQIKFKNEHRWISPLELKGRKTNGA